MSKQVITDSIQDLLVLLPETATLSVDVIEAPQYLDPKSTVCILRHDYVARYISNRYFDGQPVYPSREPVRMDHSGSGFLWVHGTGREMIWRDVRVIA